ncbi:MAG: PfkB family carbohydrate kinase [Candidatus Zipacnadales bacterium]
MTYHLAADPWRVGDITLWDIDVLGLSCSCWDMLGIVERYPALDEKVGICELVEQGGGLTATALAAVGKLGGRAMMLGHVGNDPFGQKIITALQEVGVNTSHLRVIPGARSRFAFCIVHRPTGKRSIFFDGGTAGTPAPDEIDPELIRRARAILIDGSAGEGGLRVAEIAHEHGKPIVLDLERYSPSSNALLRLATHPIVPLSFSDANPLDTCRALQELGPPTVVVTLGERGCMAVEEDTVLCVPAFDVPVVDTTGAGDVFHGAFAYGLALGKPLAENLRFASAAAALSCRALGGRAGLATMDEVEELLATGRTRTLEG